jgi:peptide/nickel transport system substrate-binding protein
MKPGRIFVFGLVVLMVAGSAANAAAPRRGGSLTYGVAASDVTVGVDPHVIQGDRTGWVLGQICEGLLDWDQGLNPVPCLAKSWDISSDGLTYTFQLEQGVKFHNGREMVADDVKYSLERILDPKTGSRRRVNLEIIDRIQVVDRTTIKITLKSRFSPFLTYLATVYAAILPKESVGPEGKITHPVGTGPFVFVEYAKNDRLKVKRFEGYWKKGLPYLDEITFKPIPDEAVRLTALRTGQVDLIHSLPESLLLKLAREKSKDFVLDIQSGVVWYMLILNTRKPPFDHMALRQAVFAALDREELMQAITSGFGEVVNDIWPKDSFWYISTPVPKPDGAKAKALLKKAGYESGIDVALECKPEFQNVAEVIQDQLKKVGIRTKIGLQDWASLGPRMQKYEFQMAVSTSSWYSDPDARYGRFYVKDGPANYFAGGYTNPRVAELVAKGREETDLNKRKADYTEVWKIVDEEVPHVMLFMLPMTHAWRNRVQNFKVSKQGDLIFSGGGLPYAWVSE